MKGKNRPGNFNFFFLHFEKIVMVILILAAGYCGYRSTNLTTLSWEATDLTNDAERAERHVSQNDVPITKYLEKMPPIPYTEYTEGIKVPIAATPYATPLKWEPSVFPERVPRGQVRVFPVEKLVATSGIGGIFLRPKDSVFGSQTSTMQSTLGGGMAGGSMSGGGETGSMGGAMGAGAGSNIDPSLIQATRWVVLTGLIPSEQQIEEYVRTFANASYTNPTTDNMPTYMFYRVYRREVKPDGSESPWIDLKALENFDRHTKTWQGFGTDPVDTAYIIQKSHPLSMVMAYPLPSALNKIWGKEAGHPPQIPLMSDSLMEAMAETQKMLQQMLQESQKTITIDAIADALANSEFDSAGGGMGTSRLGDGTGGGMPGMGGGMPGMGGGMPGMGGGMPGMGGGMPGMGGGMPGMSGNMGSGGGTGLQIILPKNEYQPMVYQKITYSLFRYIDFDVEPDKTYQYKVQLALLNPNYKMEAKYLEVPESSDAPFLFTDMSEPSTPTSVVSSARVLVHKVNPLPANRAWEGQTATVASIAFDLDDPAEYVVPNETVIRGRVLNFLKRPGSKYPPNASNASTSMMSGSGGMGGMDSPGPGGTTGNRRPTKPTVESKTLDHKTGICVADIYGGKTLIGSGNDHRIPGQTLMMSYDGTLQIQTVDSDAMEWKRYDPSAAQKTQSMMGGSGPGMMME